MAGFAWCFGEVFGWGFVWLKLTTKLVFLLLVIWCGCDKVVSMGLFTKIFGDESSRFIKLADKKVIEINALEESIKALSDEDFPKKTEELKKRIKDGSTLDDILVGN